MDFFILIDLVLPLVVIPWLTMRIADRIPPSVFRLLLVVIAYVVVAVSVLTMQELAYGLAKGVAGDGVPGASLRMLAGAVLGFPLMFAVMSYRQSQTK